MAKEIERKFLVDPVRLGPLEDGIEIRQGFIDTANLTVVRVRVSGKSAWLTLKGETVGATRTEFEYTIPQEDARQIIAEMCGGRVIVKTRYLKNCAGRCWEIDVFEEQNKGLIVAEVELGSELDEIQLPDWVTEEVTADLRYYNVNLLSKPFRAW